MATLTLNRVQFASCFLFFAIAASFSQGSPSDISNPCLNKRIYLYNLPPLFNSDLLRLCSHGLAPWLDFCSHLDSNGFGKPRPTGLGDGWHTTDAYMLEVIFHARMQRYACLTDDPDSADAFFVPYYTGLDALQYLYNPRKRAKEVSPLRHGSSLVSWLEQNAQEQWDRYGGLDHFVVMGRTSWDFGLHGSSLDRPWGTAILNLPHFANMTSLLFEKQPWTSNQQAIPYPTSFHPSPNQLQDWIATVRAAQRPSLFAFAGSIRPDLMRGGIRDLLLDECNQSSQCAMLDCKVFKCGHNPYPIVSTFLRSNFCLQPRGDTPTRRSLFDSMIAGCIPVLFHEDTAYSQYTWHLSNDSSKWSVYIPEDDIRKGVSVEEVLMSYSQTQVRELRDTVIESIPKLLYTGFSDEDTGIDIRRTPDAFDISVQKVLDRISILKQNLWGEPWSVIS